VIFEVVTAVSVRWDVMWDARPCILRGIALLAVGCSGFSSSFETPVNFCQTIGITSKPTVLLIRSFVNSIASAADIVSRKLLDRSSRSVAYEELYLLGSDVM
jgi:hypothetical protein